MDSLYISITFLATLTLSLSPKAFGACQSFVKTLFKTPKVLSILETPKRFLVFEYIFISIAEILFFFFKKNGSSKLYFDQ